jgi:SpoVK/Ycf46/Vps4 family AAA+-type ATPase
VDRRREIQKGVNVLKGICTEQRCHKYGLLIRGTAGLGKSCLAGKLIDRFPRKELFVIHGRLRAGELFSKLRKIFDRKSMTSGLEVMKSDREFEDKIKELFRTVFKEHPFILLFDDFEQNLVRYGDEHEIDQGDEGQGTSVLSIIRPILYALPWAEGQTNVIITSRYAFALEYEGENLCDSLEDLPLMSFRDADLAKKKKWGERVSMLLSWETI